MAKILVVEDESATAQLICNFLVQLNHQVTSVVEDGLHSIQVAFETHPDLILMDIHLPGEIDGITAADLIYQQFQIPIIYISATTEAEILKRAIATAAFGYLVKPFNQLQLQAAINVALQRHRLEKQLEQTKQWFAATLASIGDGAIATDQAGLITFMNPVAENLTGWQMTDALGASINQIFNLLHADTQEQIENPVMQAMQAGTRVSMPEECFLRAKDGLDRRVGDSATPIRNSNGEITGGVLVFQDITQRHQAAQTLRLQAQREKALCKLIQAVRNSLDLQTIFNTAVFEIGSLIQVDQANIVQYLPIQNSWVYLVCHGHDPDLFQSDIGSEISDIDNLQMAPLKRFEIVRLDDAIGVRNALNQTSAETFSGAWLAVPIRIGDRLWGNIGLVKHHHPFIWQDWQVELTCTVADQLAIAIQHSELYTEVQRLNAELESQVLERTTALHRALSFEALLKRITDQVRDSLDENQILQTAVDALGQGLGVECCSAGLYNSTLTTFTITHEYLVSLPPAQGQTFVVEDQADKCFYQQLFEHQCIQFCFSTENLARPSVEMQSILACPMFDDQGVLGDLWLFRPCQSVFNEAEIRLVQLVANQCAIALRQSRLYQAAQAQVYELERLNYLKDDFLSTISHELRTPMASIKMAIQMVEIALQPFGMLDNETSNVSRYFQILQTECQREINLIDDLLNLSRLDANIEPLILSTITPHIWIHHILEPFHERIAAQEQTLELEISENSPRLVTDLSYLGRILSELLDNACKYTCAGGTIQVSAYFTADGLCVEVRNTGIIPAEELPRIFDKFYRIPSSDPWRYSGVGLGLALVKKLVAHIGATIKVESHSNQTTFTVTFPQSSLISSS